MQHNFDHLVRKFLADNLDEDELRQFLAMAKANPALLASLFEEKLHAREFRDETGGLDKDQLFHSIMQRAREMEGVPVKKMVWMKKWMVAAAITLLVGLGTYFAFLKKEKEPAQVVVEHHDIESPKNNKATLVLSDGRSISIDNLSTVTDGKVTVTRDAVGNIIYTGSAEELAFNTLVNPRGSAVASTTLVDGTRVWLNAGSSIKYFASNASQERNVEITGEAYFEVAKNATKPFIVKSGGTSVKVLGTRFNVNAYEDEKENRITLFEGSVQCTVDGGDMRGNVTLKPGEQARIPQNDTRIMVSNKLDLEEVIAWKEGIFRFESATMPVILREVSRWYDVEVVYENVPPAEPYFVLMKRSNSLSVILKALQASGMKFTITGKTLIVKK